MLELLANFRIQDAVDIVLIGFVVYRIIDLIRGTRAAQMLIGLAVVFVTYLSSQYFDLYTLNWILDNFLSSFLLLIVVIFQNDIRRALTQVGAGSLFGAERGVAHQDIEEVIRSTVALAGKRIGALIVFEREVGLNEYIEVGTRLDARVSRELLLSIFMPTSPIHDGALILQKGRITAAGCFLPLTTNPNVSKTLGTRHRAAIGLTEETDAVVVVVSEEEGSISMVREGRITRDLDAGTLRSTLLKLLVE
ncbi:MAG: TIGR00159 family protein [Deltaproteobacteria bacterium]|nr:TIGR00159 family protein [Deltaproteobacteria bacterium]MBI3390282.1 TIGR00159 family protein [Deltaproteobacteria bacterium]